MASHRSSMLHCKTCNKSGENGCRVQVLVVRYKDSTGYSWSARNAESASDLCMHGASMIDLDNM